MIDHEAGERDKARARLVDALRDLQIVKDYLTGKEADKDYVLLTVNSSLAIIGDALAELEKPA